MANSSSSKNLGSSYDPQSASPLFSQVPPEIRNDIFKLALTEYNDTDQPYDLNTSYCKPGYRFRQRIHTDLLRTCRRVYEEAHLLPVAINDHVFWCYRPPPGRKYASDPSGYFGRMTSQQQDAVDCVHLFTQQDRLARLWRDVYRMPEMHPRKFKITLAYSDWELWESAAKRAMKATLASKGLPDAMGRELDVSEVKPEWAFGLRHLRGLRELVVELKTVEAYRRQLDASASRALSWKFDLFDGNILSTEGTNVVTSTWEDGIHRSEITEAGQGAEAGNAQASPQPEAKEAPQRRVPNNSNYVLSMTWRARAPTIDTSVEASKIITSHGI
ncbi:hypothetical protein MMC16_006601 [Acarospora aff. strigata]|nr:hypothetical protein [Acarospora aff. strigata]